MLCQSPPTTPKPVTPAHSPPGARELEGGKVHQTDSGGTQDAVTGQYYEGRSYNWVNFEGQNPRHPSETMREVRSYELKKLEGGR
jgi:hypothetical protein